MSQVRNGSSHDGLRRREFLQRSIGAAGASLAACSRGDPYALEKPPVPGEERWRSNEEKMVVSACAQCSAGCGIEVRVVEGRVIAVRGQRGNPVHPGGIGPRGQTGPYVVYDPDRIRGPLRRRGERGVGSFEPVSWEDALEELGSRLAGLRDRGTPERLAVVCGRERGLMREFWQRFSEAFGTPNFLDVFPRKGGAVADALYAMQGIRDLPAYDWPRTRYVLSFGAPILEESCQSIYQARSTVHHRTHRGAERGTIVHVEPSYSRTAASADEWISIAPGSYGALALGVAHVLVRDEIYDRKFVAAHGFGFADWTDEQGHRHQGFRNLLLGEYGPERVATLCDTEEGTIERLAHELVENSPSFAVVRGTPTFESGAFYTAMAVHALNALLGAIDRPGGVLTQRPAPLADWPPPRLDARATAGLARNRLNLPMRPLGSRGIDDLPDALLAEKSVHLDTLMLYYSNPLYSGVGPVRWKRALERVPFVVTFSPFLDETTTEVADLVLPDHSYLERWEDAASAPSVGYPVFGVRQPVVEPVHRTRATGDVVLEIAQRLGGAVSEAFPWRSFREALFERVKGIHEAQEGSIAAESSSRFLRQLFRTGFWNHPDYRYEQWKNVLRTPSGRFEFFSLRLWRSLSDAWLQKAGLLVERDVACLPHHPVKPDPEDVDFPLLLEPYQPGSYAEGSGANIPVLQELVTEPGDRAWETAALLHPETAGAHSIEEGDQVRVTSRIGSVVLPVALRDGIRRGSVRIAKGGGHSAWGRFAKGKGANVMELIPLELDPVSGAPVLQGVRVQIQKV